jgi:predicted site-specific integrase-resolvase
MNYVSAAEASKIFKVHSETLRDWANKGKIEYFKTPGGHRRYKIPDANDGQPDTRFRYVYARVSSTKQDGDLQRQVKYLTKKHPDYSVIKDIGSGLNFKRQGFRKILEQLFEGNISEVVVSSSDRFSRFGAREFFVWLFEHFGAKLTILENKNYANPTEELSGDLLEIVTVFAARYHGRRKYQSDNAKD